MPITRGNWIVTQSQIPGLCDVVTNESEGMICQNARPEDAEAISALPALMDLAEKVAALEPATKDYNPGIGAGMLNTLRESALKLTKGN